MRTRGHREGNIIQPGPVEGLGAREGIALGEILNVHGRVMNVAYHHGTCMPM